MKSLHNAALDIVFGGKRRGSKRDKSSSDNKDNKSNDKSVADRVKDAYEKYDNFRDIVDTVKDVAKGYQDFKDKTGYEPPHMKENWQP